jgi:hypothetical protein
MHRPSVPASLAVHWESAEQDVISSVSLQSPGGAGATHSESFGRWFTGTLIGGRESSPESRGRRASTPESRLEALSTGDEESRSCAASGEGLPPSGVPEPEPPT